MKRRTFIEVVAAGALAGCAPVRPSARRPDPAPRRGGPPLSVLVLGGTNYVGPHLVEAARAAGYAVTLFNRGYTNPGFFPDVPRLVGNRYPDRGEGLAALAGRREWDLVVDTWAGPPGCVDATVRLLRDRCGQYVYISSIAAYGGFRSVGMDEGSDAVDASPHLGSMDPDLGYVERKRAAEQRVLDVFGDRGTVLRCSSIYGCDYATNPANQQLYWPLRLLSEGPVLVPEDDGALIQWTDVADLAAFAVASAEAERGGIFNTLGPPAPFAGYIDAWHQAGGRAARRVTAPLAFLRQHGVHPFSDLPAWIPADDAEPGFYQIVGRRAAAAGYRQRPLEETVAAVLSCLPPDLAPDSAPEGMRRERELTLVWALDRPS